MTSKRLYLDYNASAPLHHVVKMAIPLWLDIDLKNASSSHAEGRQAHNLIEKARKDILTLLGAGPKDCLVFTSGSTEANNTVIESAYRLRKARHKFLLTNVEHSSVHKYAKELEARGVELVFANVDRHGHLDLDDYAKRLSADVFLSSVMLVQNETGFILPVEKMARLAREKGIPFHTDVVCAAGKIPINFEKLGADFLTFSSHKFGGLKGVGGIVYRREATLKPMIFGGPHEGEKRAGTENVLGILSSALALEESLKGIDAKMSHLKLVRQKIKQDIKAIYPAADIIEATDNLPGTLSVCFSPLSGQVLLTNLDLEGVSASYGSACASGSLELSRAILALGLTPDQAGSTLRFSFGSDITSDDADDFLERLKKIIARSTP